MHQPTPNAHQLLSHQKSQHKQFLSALPPVASSPYDSAQLGGGWMGGSQRAGGGGGGGGRGGGKAGPGGLAGRLQRALAAQSARQDQLAACGGGAVAGAMADEGNGPSGGEVAQGELVTQPSRGLTHTSRD